MGPQNGVLSAPAPAAPQGQQQRPQGQQPGQTPAPTHGQTVAALRHFAAIQGKLKAILKDPALGKSSMKSKIIDGMTELVQERIIPPGAAVQQLASVPDKPFDQRKWLQQHYLQAVMAQAKVLDDHAKAFGGQPEQQIDKTSSPDDHMTDMAALHGQYGGGRG
jgi:hypothetical protein